jgi:hypothetical protein
MKLYIPSIGDIIRLTQDWEFNLYAEDRNSTLMEIVGDKRDPWDDRDTAIKVVIPAQAELKIDRIYIRKGQDEFDSVTFLWKGMTTAPRVIQKTATKFASGRDREDFTYTQKIPKRPVRFWAKLSDVNNIEFEEVK